MKSGGGFTDELGGEHWGIRQLGKDNWESDVLPVTVLGTVYARSWWEKSYEEDPTPKPADCQSIGGVHPQPGLRFDGPCATCPMSQWVEDPDPKRQGKRKLPCQPSIVAVVYNHQTERVGLVRFKRRGINNFADYAVTFRVANRRKSVPIYAVVTEIRLKAVPDEYGKDGHLEPVFTRGPILDMVAVRDMIAMRKAIGVADTVVDDLARGDDNLDPAQPGGGPFDGRGNMAYTGPTGEIVNEYEVDIDAGDGNANERPF
jgi:hypothetical protein